LPTAARIGAFSGFETALDPKFARAQRRYLGASDSVDHNDLRGSVPATAFTMSIQFHQHPAATLSSVDLGGARIRVLAGQHQIEARPLRMKLPRLYASAWSWRRTALAANLRHDSSVAVIRGSR
jgi:hypothetical protein